MPPDSSARRVEQAVELLQQLAYDRASVRGLSPNPQLLTATNVLAPFTPQLIKASATTLADVLTDPRSSSEKLVGFADSLGATDAVKQPVMQRKSMKTIKYGVLSSPSRLLHDLNFRVKTSGLMQAGCIAILVVSSNVFAGSATWKANPSSGDWNTASNWTPATVPNGISDTATFRSSNQTDVSLSANTEVNGIVFDTDASPFTVSATPALRLTISGAGITNNSGNEQVIEAGDSDQDSLPGGSVIFDKATAAGASTLIALAHGQSPGNSGTIQFLGSSYGNRANVMLYGGYYNSGTLDISAHNAPGVKIGSLAGGGEVYVGTNNLLWEAMI